MTRYLLIVALVVTAGLLHAATPTTNEIAFSVLKVAPEKHKNKLLSYTEVYINFLTTFPEYMEGSGFKSSRWILLEVGDPRLPVLAKKSDDMVAMVSGLKAGAMVKVTGRVREFKLDPRFAMAPTCYVEAESIIVDSTAPVREMRTPPNRPIRRRPGGPVPPP
jgi:hypothetical protein